MPPEVIIEVPEEDWLELVGKYTGRYGEPEFSPLGSTIENARGAKWDTGVAILHLTKVEVSELLKTINDEVLTAWETAADAELFFEVLKLFRKVKEEFHEVTVIPITAGGKEYNISIGTVYFYQLRNSLGQLVPKTRGVLHNPPN